ncbi:hypothetical protein LDENG_00277360 [Lucifuga dentata]|nr:hypothetical protein LDENG_00277360 [Lucifuga dentata]
MPHLSLPQVHPDIVELGSLPGNFRCYIRKYLDSHVSENKMSPFPCQLQDCLFLLISLHPYNHSLGSRPEHRTYPLLFSVSIFSPNTRRFNFLLCISILSILSFSSLFSFISFPFI